MYSVSYTHLDVYKRQILLSLFAEHPEWADGVRRLLGSKKAADREMALEILRRWGPKPFAGELSAMLEREKSQKLAALCRDLLGLQEEEAAAPVGEQDPVKAALKGGKARKVQWLFDTPFLPVRRTDGNQAEDEPVSYTHLDVYKRQGSACTRSADGADVVDGQQQSGAFAVALGAEQALVGADVGGKGAHAAGKALLPNKFVRF